MWPIRFLNWKFLSWNIILWLLLSPHLSAQEQPVIYSFLPEIYQASPQNWSVSETEHGVVFGNSSGVLTYDGAHWKTHSIPGNHRVRSICSKNDTIFCGGYGEFGFWIPTNTGELEYQSLNEHLDFPLTEKEDIWHIESYKSGVLFQSFSTIYLYENDSITIINAPYSSGIMFSYYCHGAFYLQIIDGGLARFEPGNEIEVLSGCEALEEITVTGIEEFGDGLLISTDKQGLFIYEDGLLRPVFQNLKQQFAQSQINKVLVTEDLIIVGTILEGVYVIDSEGTILFHFSTESGLPDNTVLSLAISDAGGLWVGLDYGLAYIDLSSPFFRYLDEEGTLGVVFCAIEYNDNLYLGTNHGLFRRRRSGESIVFDIIAGTQGQVWSLQVVGGNTLYCGHNKGTFEINGSTATLVSDITGPWSWLETAQPGPFIQGTYTGIVIGSKHAEFRRLEQLNGPIRDLVRDKTGNIWGVNPYKGLYRLRLRESPEGIEEIAQSLDSWKLPDLNRLRMMKIGDDIIVRSDSGWFQLDQNKLSFDKIPSYRGLDFSAESLRLFDFDDNLLLIEKNRVAILHGDHKLAFETTENLPEDPFAIKVKSGGFLVGTSQGYLVAYPDKLVPTKLPAPFITQVSVLGESETVPYPIPLDSLNTIQLSSDQGGLTIEFSSGFAPAKQYYRFRIGETNGNISEWSSKARMSIPLLPYGETMIRIERKSDGQLLRIRCVREFPWYMSNLGISGFLILGFLIIYLMLKQYQVFLRRKWRKQQIEEARQRHARLIEEKNKQLEHDIEGQNQELAGVTMSLVRKNELILELKESLRLFEKKPEETSLRSIILKLNSQLSSEKDWEAFEYHFSRVHQSFFTDLKKEYPRLTSGDLRLAAYLRMNLSSKEIAPLLHISVRSLENKRYRLRKKLELSPDQQIIDILLKF